MPTTFTVVQKMIIAKAVKVRVDLLMVHWEKKMTAREKRIMQCVSDTIANLPTDDDVDRPKPQSWLRRLLSGG